MTSSIMNWRNNFVSFFGNRSLTNKIAKRDSWIKLNCVQQAAWLKNERSAHTTVVIYKRSCLVFTRKIINLE